MIMVFAIIKSNFGSDTMQESKYYYQGIPLSKYCKENNINISKQAIKKL